MSDNDLNAIKINTSLTDLTAVEQVYKNLYGDVFKNEKMLAALAGTASAFIKVDAFINNDRTMKMAAELAGKIDHLANPLLKQMMNSSIYSMISKLENQSRLISDNFVESHTLRKISDFVSNVNQYNTKIGVFLSKNNSILDLVHQTSNQHDIFAAAQSLYKTSLGFDDKNITIDFLSEVLSDDELGVVTTLQDDDLSPYTSRFNDIENIDSAPAFKIFMDSLPKNIRQWFAVLFLYLLIPSLHDIFNAVVANLITPSVQSYLASTNKNDKEKVHDIRVLPLTDVDKSQIRFITREIVYLRATPSQKSAVIDELTLGQVVTVQSKNKNWIEVSYQYESGEIIRGWVFTRYTERFKW
ncbi:SH3 domain-containing protein [Serratia fonticola]|uniref:SH3 domain-containing protein n=1 Tax=Serratia fonticola TaxID=47917 RepID=UPI0027F90191|nr:SH3 domain-containing protein [Serratia fonticola]MDQ7210915.1 SH3 domain-containing protein [Serratia fonticola]HBE9080967.1 SH3 domain-containing protein [Serratia fonticola]HBE9091493.1 SH3 domain-containing protein [Serratia fonticola]HBE9153987.1 SH3 domain-containing protein [Serratia fonticola]